MSIIFILIPLSILVAAGFLAAFIWAVRSGQYEDTCTPSMRVLMDPAGGERRSPASVPPITDAPAVTRMTLPESRQLNSNQT